MSQLCHCKAALSQVIFRGTQPLIMMPFGTEKLDSTTPEPSTVEKAHKHFLNKSSE